MYNVVFLDIDGVLVCPQNKLSDKHEGLEFDSASVNVLKEILDKFDAKLIITSSWRINKSLEQLQELFRFYGLSSYVLDKLPDFVDYMERENAIKSYVNLKGISNYLILDDMPFETLQKNAIQTELRKGLKAIPQDTLKNISILFK